MNKLIKFRYETPTGKKILGTLDEIPGRANVESLTRDPRTKTIDIVYSGETTVFWDGQRTITRKGQRIWLDENGDEWPENKLIEVPIDE